MSASSIRQLASDQEIAAAFAVMKELRPHLAVNEFLPTVRRLEQNGYRLIGCYSEGALVSVAGIRDAHTLARGPHLFVDDLVTPETQRNKGFGKKILQWVAKDAAERGLPRVYLDSRDTALGFYTRLGFHALTPVVCWITVEDLVLCG